MSFDIIVLHPKPSEPPLQSITEVTEAFPLGTPEEIRAQCNAVLSGIVWDASGSGLYSAPEGFTLEVAIPDETRPSSLHLSLHFGSAWGNGGSSAFDRLVRQLYESLSWQSFAVSDNTSLLLEEGQ